MSWRAAHSLARFQKYMGTRVDPFLMNSSEGKGHTSVSLPQVCVPFPSRSEVAPTLALYLRTLNINVPEPKAHNDFAGVAPSDCQMHTQSIIKVICFYCPHLLVSA